MRRPVAIGIGVVVAAVVCLTGREGRAAAIHHRVAQPEAFAVHGMPAAEVSTFKEWSRYLLAGPSAWERVAHPPVPAVVRSAIWVSVRHDPGPTDPMVNFLLWKQSIDPTRFARYHPRLAPALRRIAMSRAMSAAPTTTGPPSTLGSVGDSTTTATATATPSTTTTAQANLYPPAVPEPGMLLVVAAMSAWFVRRHHDRSGEGRE